MGYKEKNKVINTKKKKRERERDTRSRVMYCYW